MTEEIRPHDDLLIYLRTLAGEPKLGQCFDVRWKTLTGGMHRRFVSALRIGETARLITRMASWTDVYVGVALREWGAGSGKRAIAGSRLLFVDCDDSGIIERLAELAPPPTMVVASGTPGHTQMYWLLDRPAVASHVEGANRRLASALGGDQACVDIARILRPPRTFNYKTGRRCAVTLIGFQAQARYELSEVVAGLPEPRSPRRATNGLQLARRRCTVEDRQLLAIPTADYVRVLGGREPNRAGKVACPFHDDRTPSLQVYEGGSFYCFGCRRGGTIYDFAAHLWGVEPRGDGFWELRSRLTTQFGIQAA
jgi:hypothetical protein